MLSAPSDSVERDGAIVAAAWLAAPGATPATAYFGLASELEGGYARYPVAWASLGLAGAATPTRMDDTPAPYGGAQALSTRVEPAQPGAYHGSTAVDRNTPLLSDGTPALAPAWRYLCFPQATAAITTIGLPLIAR